MDESEPPPEYYIRQEANNDQEHSESKEENVLNVDKNNTQVELDLAVYRRRWYIVIVFSFFRLTQAGVWNTWGPIAAATEHAYGWSDSDIAFFANWGPIAYIPMALPSAWLVDTKGLRWACLVASALVTSGAGLRCFVSSPPTNKWFIHLGHMLNGIAGPVGKGAPPALSAAWFPPEQRTTATAVTFASEALGVGLAYLIGPLVVPEYHEDNTTSLNISVVNESGFSQISSFEDAFIQMQRDRIMEYMYGTFGFCAAIFLLVVIYFPARPPKAPSPSALMPRLNYMRGLKRLARNRRFWHIAIIFGFSSGTREAWGSMLGVNLKAHGISQTDAGWLGFYGTVAAGVTSIIIAKFADVFKKRLKKFLLGLYILVLLFYLWMVLQILDIIPKQRETLYTSLIGASVLAGACGPLFFELVCETTYPIAEGITNLSLTAQNNVASIIFLGILSIPNIRGTIWMNWFLIATYAVSIILILLLKEGHHRLDVDEMVMAATKRDSDDVIAKKSPESRTPGVNPIDNEEV